MRLQYERSPPELAGSECNGPQVVPVAVNMQHVEVTLQDNNREFYRHIKLHQTEA